MAATGGSATVEWRTKGPLQRARAHGGRYGNVLPAAGHMTGPKPFDSLPAATALPSVGGVRKPGLALLSSWCDGQLRLRRGHPLGQVAITVRSTPY
jgi:hypothetical protein